MVRWFAQSFSVLPVGMIVANCLAHARRQFVEIHDLFPSECGHVLEALKTVYKNDAVARKGPVTNMQGHAPTAHRGM